MNFSDRDRVINSLDKYLTKKYDETIVNGVPITFTGIEESGGMGSYETFYITFSIGEDDGLEIRYSDHSARYDGFDVALWNGNYSSMKEVKDAVDKAVSDYVKENQTDYSIEIDYSRKATDSEGNELSEQQQEYFKDSKVRDDNGNLMVVYHGTVHDFTVFNRDFANSEGDWGKGFYFTTSYDDVEENYANEEGPDLVNKIETYLDRHEYDDEFEDMDRDEIREIVKRRFITAEPNIIEAYLNITNPVYRGENETFFNYYEDYDEETDEYIEPEGELVDLVEALENTKNEFEFYGDFSVWAMLGDYYYDGMSLSDVVTALEESVGKYLEVTDEEGNFAHKEWLRRALEEMGYDGIIDTTVSDRFNTMNGLYSDTTHYIVFNSNQAKKTDNLKPTINNDIRFSRKNSFKNALNEKEYKLFNAIAMNNNQYDNLRIDDNGALIPTEKADEYKLVYYYEDSDSKLNIQSVYKLENYDYNMRDGSEYNYAKLIIDLEERGTNEQLRKRILQDIARNDGVVFRRYNRDSGKYTVIAKYRNRTKNNTKGTNNIEQETTRAKIYSGDKEVVDYSRKSEYTDVNKALSENEELQEAVADLKDMLIAI